MTNISHFKDISKQLSNKYPNKKVYVISDHHFFHSNIIKYSNREFNNIIEMNEYMIKKHNETITNNDIVIFLGDFCFKNSEAKNILEKLNGHKFLVVGNHDNNYIIKKYKYLGFEDLFLYPVKFQDYCLSHYPLNGETPEEIIYNILKKEFNEGNYNNLYGHVHKDKTVYPNSINVSCEVLDYIPCFIGYTSCKEDKNNDNLFITDDKFKTYLDTFVNSKGINKNLLIDDYIYTYIMEQIGSVNNLFFQGSFTMYKMYNYVSNFSDLDASLIYDDKLSKNKNVELLKKIVSEVYNTLKNITGINLNYCKKMSLINILEILYLDGYGYVNESYLDINIIDNGIYKDSDFINHKGITTFEKLLAKYYPDELSKYKLPNYDAKFLNNTSIFSNLILQYLYQYNYPEKKKEILKKIKCVLNNININDNFNNNLEDTLIRFFIRNVLFLLSLKRIRDIEYIFDEKNIDTILLNELDTPYINDIIKEIIKNPKSDFNKSFNYIKNSNINSIKEASKDLIKSRSKL